MVRIGREYETEMGIKVILAAIIGMVLSDWMGFRNSLTITFTMILVSYVNRGFYGSADYFRVRMQYQTLLVLLMYLMVVPLQKFTQLPGWLIEIITIVPTAGFFLYMFFAHAYTPINLSPVVSPLMLMNTALGDPTFYSRRILFTFLGLVLGWAVSMIIPLPGKVGRAKMSMWNITEYLCGKLQKIGESGELDLGSDYAGNTADITFELSELTAYLNVVYKDSTIWKYKSVRPSVPEIRKTQAALDSLFALTEAIAKNRPAITENDGEFLQAFTGAIAETARCHQALLSKREAPAQGEFIPEAKSTASLTLSAAYIVYKRNVAALSAVKNGR